MIGSTEVLALSQDEPLLDPPVPPPQRAPVSLDLPDRSPNIGLLVHDAIPGYVEQLWARYLEGDNISTKIGSGRDKDRGGLPDFLKN